MKLYDSMGPNPHVVRMYAAELGIELPREKVDLMGGENRQGDYLAKNPPRSCKTATAGRSYSDGSSRRHASSKPVRT